MESIAISKKKKKKVSKLARASEWQCYMLLALPLTGFFVFTLYPILWSAVKSFYFYNQIPSDTRFVGLENYVTIFTKTMDYWKAWITTLQFTVYKLPFEVGLALVLALLLSKKIKGASVFRMVYFMPTVISVALSSVIFTNLFQYFGYFNDLFMRVGLISKPIDWFATKSAAMFMLCAGNIWACFGINVLYFSSALTNVPDELYEAAEIDGAGPVRKFFSITIPMIAPVFQVILLMAINGTLHVGEYIMVMTAGAPAGTTHTVGSYMLSNFVPGFAEGTVNVGFGCSVAIINSIIYSLVAVIYMKLSERMKNVY